jgi:hypothetical protein
MAAVLFQLHDLFFFLQRVVRQPLGPDPEAGGKPGQMPDPVMGIKIGKIRGHKVFQIIEQTGQHIGCFFHFFVLKGQFLDQFKTGAILLAEVCYQFNKLPAVFVKMGDFPSGVGLKLFSGPNGFCKKIGCDPVEKRILKFGPAIEKQGRLFYPG